MRFDQLVRQASYPGSPMVPATSALLSLLVLKLLDKERRSHINDFNFDEAVGLFAGLNAKKSTPPTTPIAPCDHQQKLLSGADRRHSTFVVSASQHLLPRLSPDPVFRAMPPGWTSTTCPGGAKPGPIVLSFAQEHDSRVLCYANANLPGVTRLARRSSLSSFGRSSPEAIPSGCTD